MGPSGKAPELVYECTYRAQIQPPLDIGAGPIGHRMIFPVTEGEVVGERLNGVIHPGGGEWFLAGADGFGRVDVRFQMTTNDGANIYWQYFGVLELTDTVMGAIGSGAATDFEDHYFRTTPRPRDRRSPLRLGEPDRLRRQGSCPTGLADRVRRLPRHLRARMPGSSIFCNFVRG